MPVCIHCTIEVFHDLWIWQLFCRLWSPLSPRWGKFLVEKIDSLYSIQHNFGPGSNFFVLFSAIKNLLNSLSFRCFSHTFRRQGFFWWSIEIEVKYFFVKNRRIVLTKLLLYAEMWHICQKTAYNINEILG